MDTLPKPPLVDDPHSAHHRWLHDRLTGADPLLVAGPGIIIDQTAESRLVISSTARGGAASEKIRIYLCDAVDPSKNGFYLIAAERDSNQDP